MANRSRRAADARTPPASAAERAALKKHEARLHALLARGESSAYDAGLELDAIARDGLHHARGFATLAEYVEATYAQGYTTLKRYRRVATKFSRASVRKHGVTKLDLGLTYIELTPENETPAELLRLMVRVPAKATSTKPRTVPFDAATPKQLEQAILAAKSGPDAHDDVATARAKRVRTKLQAAIAAPKGEWRHAPVVRVHPHPEQMGNVRVDVVGIDGDDLARVAKALLASARSASFAAPMHAKKANNGKNAKGTKRAKTVKTPTTSKPPGKARGVARRRAVA